MMPIGFGPIGSGSLGFGSGGGGGSGLDTKAKRGAILEMLMPHRTWLSEPAGALTVGDRQSVMKLSYTPSSTVLAFKAAWAANSNIILQRGR